MNRILFALLFGCGSAAWGMSFNLALASCTGLTQKNAFLRQLADQKTERERQQRLESSRAADAVLNTNLAATSASGRVDTPKKKVKN